MTPKTPWILLLVISLPLALGCGGLAGDDDDATGDDDDGPSYLVEVTYDGSTEPVDLFDLDTQDWEGSVAVAVPDVLDAAGVASPDSYTYTFTAYDDYFRDGIPWDKAEQAVMIQDSGDLKYPDAANMEGADKVKGVVSIELTPVT